MWVGSDKDLCRQWRIHGTYPAMAPIQGGLSGHGPPSVLAIEFGPPWPKKKDCKGLNWRKKEFKKVIKKKMGQKSGL